MQRLVIFGRGDSGSRPPAMRWPDRLVELGLQGGQGNVGVQRCCWLGRRANCPRPAAGMMSQTVSRWPAVVCVFSAQDALGRDCAGPGKSHHHGVADLHAEPLGQRAVEHDFAPAGQVVAAARRPGPRTAASLPIRLTRLALAGDCESAFSRLAGSRMTGTAPWRLGAPTRRPARPGRSGRPRACGRCDPDDPKSGCGGSPASNRPPAVRR